MGGTGIQAANEEGAERNMGHNSNPRTEADFGFASSGLTPQGNVLSSCMNPLPSSDDKSQTPMRDNSDFRPLKK
jgi:hypothetical protein